jgi:hypothetical protein
LSVIAREHHRQRDRRHRFSGSRAALAAATSIASALGCEALARPNNYHLRHI